MTRRPSIYKDTKSEQVVILKQASVNSQIGQQFIALLKAKGLKRLSYLDFSKLAIQFQRTKGLAEILQTDSLLISKFIAGLADLVTFRMYHLDRKVIDIELD